jgi:hypothetical protein
MAHTSESKSLVSYWWFAVSNCGVPPLVVCVSVPMDASDAGGRWCGFAVDA